MSQIWIILIGFRDMNDFVNLGICQHVQIHLPRLLQVYLKTRSHDAISYTQLLSNSMIRKSLWFKYNGTKVSYDTNHLV